MKFKSCHTATEHDTETNIRTQQQQKKKTKAQEHFDGSIGYRIESKYMKYTKRTKREGRNIVCTQKKREKILKHAPENCLVHEYECEKRVILSIIHRVFL